MAADLDDSFSYSIEDSDANTLHPSAKDLKSNTHTYYQALIDSRDCPFVVSWMRADAGCCYGIGTSGC